MIIKMLYRNLFLLHVAHQILVDQVCIAAAHVGQHALQLDVLLAQGDHLTVQADLVRLTQLQSLLPLAIHSLDLVEMVLATQDVLAKITLGDLHHLGHAEQEDEEPHEAAEDFKEATVLAIAYLVESEKSNHRGGAPLHSGHGRGGVLHVVSFSSVFVEFIFVRRVMLKSRLNLSKVGGDVNCLPSGFQPSMFEITYILITLVTVAFPDASINLLWLSAMFPLGQHSALWHFEGQCSVLAKL